MRLEIHIKVGLEIYILYVLNNNDKSSGDNCIKICFVIISITKLFTALL